MMEVFINELSLNSQFNNYEDFKKGVNHFIDLLIAISEVRPDDCLVFYSELLYSYHLLYGSRFDTSMKHNVDLNQRFLSNFQRLTPRLWKIHQEHDSFSIYKYRGNSCNETSLAEIAERNISRNNYKGILINFIDSDFGEDINADVVKYLKDPTSTTVLCSFDKISLFECLKLKEIPYRGMRSFDPNPKHDRRRPHYRASRLLCDKQEAQALLDSAFYSNSPLDKNLFNYDTTVKKVIRFIQHRPGRYHGFHVDDLNDVPSEIIEQLEKNYSIKLC